MIPWDAVVLAGGRGSRMGGADKPALVVGGRTLLGHALAAAADAAHRVVVGPARTGDDPAVRRVLEEPRWSGPVAALNAGLVALADSATPLVAVLAADQPAAVPALAAVLAVSDFGVGADGWLAIDPLGRRQPLLAVYRADMLRAALDDLRADGPIAGASMGRLLAYLDLVEVPLSGELCRDVDNPGDLAVLRPEEASGARIADLEAAR